MRWLALVVAAGLGCSGQAPVPEEPLRIEAGAESVPVGRAFPLMVVRTWSTARTPQDWNDEALAPLTVKLVETTRRNDGRRVEETRRYEAYAFAPGAIESPVPLRVEATLDPANPGPPELPDEGSSSTTWIWPVLGAALVAVFLLARRRRPVVGPVETSPEAPPEGPEVKALRRIEGLRAQRPRGREETQAFYLEATGLLRSYLAERFGENTGIRTSHELFTRHAALRPPLSHCDLVLFARLEPSDTQRETMLDEAEAFVRESA